MAAGEKFVAADSEFEVVQFDLGATGVFGGFCGGVTGLYEEIGCDFVEDTDSFVEGFLSSPNA